MDDQISVMLLPSGDRATAVASMIGFVLTVDLLRYVQVQKSYPMQ